MHREHTIAGSAVAIEAGDVAAAVARARARLGLTKKALAHASGLSRLTIAQLEADAFSDLGIRKVQRVLAVLGLRMKIEDRARAARARERGGIAAGRGAGVGSRLGRLFAARASARRRRALELAARTMRVLRRAGVSSRVVGSLAKGTFRAGSDVDLLIETRGGVSESRIMGIVESSMKGFPFDVTFADRADPRLLEMMREEARNGASAVRAA